MSTTDIATLARKAKSAGKILAALSATQRRALLNACAEVLGNTAVRETLFVENAKDMEAAQAMVAAGEMEPALVNRLALSNSKLDSLCAGLGQLAQKDEILGQRIQHRKLDDALVLEQVSAPLGLLGIIFESRPDAVPQISGLALKSGNAVILKGGKEALHSNRALVKVLQEVLENHHVPKNAITLIEARTDVAAMLKLNAYVDMIIARGSSAFVRYIMDNTTIPVMGHAEGLCHLYIHNSAEPEMAAALAVDAKTTYPAACNAIETLLWDKGAESALEATLIALERANVQLRVCAHTRALKAFTHLPAAEDADWGVEYGTMTLAVKRVEDMEEALAHIETFGSGHTETVVATDVGVAERFLSTVDAACVFHNASSRFADGYRFGLGAEVGISTGKLHARGPVGVEGLLTSRWLLRGAGQLSADYDAGRKQFAHEDLTL